MLVFFHKTSLHVIVRSFTLGTGELLLVRKLWVFRLRCRIAVENWNITRMKFDQVRFNEQNVKLDFLRKKVAVS